MADASDAFLFFREGKRAGNLSGQAGVVEQEGQISPQGLAAGQFGEAGEQEGRQRLAMNALFGGFAACLFDDGGDFFGGDFVFEGERLTDQHGRFQSQPPVGVRKADNFFGRVEPGADGQSAAARVEGGKFVCPVADDRHGHRFQVFQRGGQVEDGFGPGADDDHRGICQRLQVGGDVERLDFVDSADSAGGEEADAGAVGGEHRPGNGGAAAFPLQDGGGKVAAADFADVCLAGQAFQFGVAQAEADFSVQDGDGGRLSAVLAHDALHLAGELQVLRAGQAVGDDGRFEGNNGGKFVYGNGHAPIIPAWRRQ